MGVRVALAQINTTVGDIDGNWGKILNGIQEAKDEGCDIIVFPELAICGYPPEDLLLRKSFLHECHSSVLNLAKHANGITALVGSPWKYKWGEHRRSYNHNGEELYNAAVLMSQGKIQDIYFKTELPNYGPFDEKRYFSRLDDPECLVFIMNGLRFNITICEDVWIWPSPVQTLAGMNDVDVTLNLSASPFYVNKLEDRSYVLQKFCEHTGSSMVYTNLVGCQDELIFDGSSMVLDAWGGVQHMAERFQEDLMIVDLDAETYTRKREDRGYLFRDYYGTTATIERTFAYVVEPNTLPEVHKSHKSNTTFFEGWLHGDAENEEMWGALVLGIKDYVTKNGFTDVVLGVSGGIDSSVVLALAVEALGHEHVHAISMPSWVSSEDTRNDAQILAKNFEVHFEEIHIGDVTDFYRNAITGTDVWTEAVGEGNSVVWENIQARTRGNILMALSNQFNWLVLSTGNKSETAVGYCTLYGDMAGGYAPIKDVPKLDVYKIAEYANEIRALYNLGGIPESIINRPPSAELSPNQEDTQALGPYQYVDQVVEMYVEQDKPRAEVIHYFNNLAFPMIPDPVENAIKIMNLIDRSEYKRRQSPPGIKITPKAFGKDRRMPITNRFHS